MGFESRKSGGAKEGTMDTSSAPHTKLPRALRRSGLIAAALILAVAVIPSAAAAKPLKTKLRADIFGLIDRDASVNYHVVGIVFAQGLNFRCMERRTVILFRVKPGGNRQRVLTTRSRFLGSFDGVFEMPLDAIPGRYYAWVKPKITRTRRGRLRCQADRTPTMLVEVPDGLIGGAASAAPARSR